MIHFNKDKFDYEISSSKKLSLSYIYQISSHNHNNKNIVIFHANGYSAQTYKKILKIFFQNDFSVFALNFSSHSYSENYEDFKDWFFFRDQILAFLNFLKNKYKISKFHIGIH